MNVLFISHRPPYPPNKGEKLRTFNQIKYLRELGHQIFVCSPVGSADDIRHLEALQHAYCESVFYSKISGKLGYIKALLTNRPLSAGYFYSPALQKRLDAFLQTHAIDAIFCTSSAMADYIFRSKTLSANTSRPRLIMDFMDMDSAKWHQYESMKPFPMNRVYGREHRLLKTHEQLIQKNFDACLFVSTQEAELFMQQLDSADNVHGVSNGLDTEFFQPGTFRHDLNHAPVFIFTGAMDYFPNTDAVQWFVRHCWNNILERFPKARFYIAGMNPTSSIKALERQPGITVTGFVDDIRDYYHRADIFVAPMQVARGLQNKVLEAFATGLPVITTSQGAEGIDCTAGEELLVADSPDAFLENIFSLIEQPERRQRLRKKALDLITTQYSWKSRLAALDPIVRGATEDSVQLAGSAP